MFNRLSIAVAASLLFSQPVFSHGAGDRDDLRTELDGLQAQIDDLIDKIADSGGNASSMPSGSLLILARTETGCPAGWKEFEEAFGRYLVGAAERKDVGKDVGIRLDPLEDRATGKHSHSYVDYAPIGNGKKIRGGVGGYDRKKLAEDTGEAGDKDDTNAPYRTVFYCEKI